MNLKATKTIKYRLVTNETTKIYLNDCKPELPSFSNNTILNIDLIKNSKRAKGAIEDLSRKNLKEKIKELKNNTKYINKKFYFEFPEVKKQPESFKIDYTEFDLQEITREMKASNKEIKKDKKIKKLTSSIVLYKSIEKLFSKEIEYATVNNNLYLNIGAVYKDKGISQHYVEKLTVKDYNIEKLHSELKEKIALEKNPQTSKEHYPDLIISPKVFSQLIEYFIFENLKLEDIKLHNNFISKRFGKELFDKKLTITEDPFINNSPYSEKYDYEFSKTTKKEIIKNGVPKSCFVDLEDAFKYNEEPTGNKFAEISCTNVIGKPGNKPLDKLISETDKGIIIREIIGLHTSNSKEGALNVAVNIANEIINGEIRRNVKNIPLAIKITDLFSNIELSKEREEEQEFLLPYIVKRGL